MQRHTGEGRTLLQLAVERGLVSSEQAAAAHPRIGNHDSGRRLLQLGLLDGRRIDALRRDFQAELRSHSSFRVGANLFENPPAATLPILPPPPVRIGNYRLLGELGRGAMGVVHRARDEIRAIDVAVKLLPDHVAGDPYRRRRLLEEARKAARMDHSPHVVTVFEAGVADGHAFLAMELVEGKTLEDCLLDATIDAATIEDLLRQLVDGIAAAHAVGLVHRDIKPSNLMITAGGVLKILDFGLAKDLVGPRVADSIDSVVGTPIYMAPELLQMALGLLPIDDDATKSTRIDVYAVGVTVCEAFGRSRPFGPVHSYGQLLAQKQAIKQTIRRALGKRPPLPWRTAVPLMLAFDPAARPIDGFALRQLLIQARDPEGSRPQRLGARTAGLSAVVLVVAMVAGWLAPSPLAIAAMTLLALIGIALWSEPRRPSVPPASRADRVAQAAPSRGPYVRDAQPPTVALDYPVADAEDTIFVSRPRSAAMLGAPDSHHDRDAARSLPMLPVEDIAFHEEYWIGSRSLKVCIGNLARLAAEGWVSPDDSHLTMSGGVSAAIAARLGDAHRRAGAALAPAPAGTVVVTGIGVPPLRCVLHAITIGVDGSGRAVAPTLESIVGCLAEIFRIARQRRLRSLAIPSLGTGAGGLPPTEVAQIICSRALEELLDRDNTALRTIAFVASHANDPLLAAVRGRILDGAPREMVVRRGTGAAWAPSANTLVRID